jgi:hypothetical protein
MKSFIILISSFVVGFACTARSQITALSSDRQEEKIRTVKIVIHPMPEPRSAMQYQLFPPLIDRKPGNAAVLYNRIPAENTTIFGDGDLIDKIDRLRTSPLADFRNAEIRRLVPEAIVRGIIRAAHSDYCDWQLPFRDGGLFWAMLLPDLQQTRHYGRFLAAYARMRIADGKYEEAIGALQAGYALARHVAAGQTLVHGLVGNTISGYMTEQLRELLQQPDAPNLYWALNALPRPVVDLRPGLEAEFDAFYLSFPELRDLEKKKYSPEQWRDLLDNLGKKMDEFVMEFGLSRPRPFVLETLSFYPSAKRFLIARGASAESVEAMPVAQVILIDFSRHFEEVRDNVYKWCFASYSQLPSCIPQANVASLNAGRNKANLFGLEAMLLPGIVPAMYASLGNERNITALQVLEALRIYAASHDGRLPKNLADITEVPVPQDPLNGKPFLYRCEGNKATLESPNLPGSSVENYYLRYEIEMQPNKK